MSGFLRPEAVAALSRWREAIAGLALAALGAWWILRGVGIVAWLGWPVLAGAGALIWAGVQRARFRGAGDGPGLVQVDERLVTYWGPLTGGVVAIADIDRVTLDRTGHPAHWVLRREGQPPLFIPVSAEGADALFDAFAALPGFDTGRMLAAIGTKADAVTVVWQRRRRTEIARLER